MPLVLADRVQESTTTTGTGTITLAGAVAGFQSFSVVGNGNTTFYCVTSGTAWEVGIGTYTSAGTTLARTTILASSASGSAITLAGTSYVFCTLPGTAPAAQAGLYGFATTATAGTTTTLTNKSNVYQVFTGSSAQTVQLPSTATLTQGWFFHIVNNSTGTLTVQTSTAVSLGTVPPGVTMMTSVVDTTVNTAAGWEVGYTDFSTLTGTGSVVLATSPTISYLSLATGTATAGQAPLKFTSGTNLATVEAGAVEYDGTIISATSNTNFKRGTVPITNYTSGVGTSLTATTETTLQILLPAANDTITLSTGTYFLDLACTFTRGTVSTTSSQARINLLGTGTAVGTFSGMAIGSPTAGGASANFSFNAVNINTSNIVTTASTTALGVYTITLRGLMKITTQGTIIPQYNLSVNLASAGTATVPVVLYFRLQQIDSQNAAAFGPAGTGWG